MASKLLLQSPFMGRIFLGLMVTPLLLSAAPPERFVSRGPGGGGAFFAGSINPHRPDEIWMPSDMSPLLRSWDFGRTWETLDFRVIQGGNHATGVQFTSNPRILNALNQGIPSRSADGGTTWTPIPLPGGSAAYTLFADPGHTNRVIASSSSTLYFSENGGTTYSARHTASDLLVAGVFWQEADIQVGSRAGVLVSTDAGASFTQTGMPGIPPGNEMVSFAGARQDGTNRFFCVTHSAGGVYPGMTGADYSGYRGVFRKTGSGAWTPSVTGLDTSQLSFVGMAAEDIDNAYTAGSDGSSRPVVARTTDGGTTWSVVLRCAGNQNVATGWSGDDAGAWNWKKWSFGECALGFAVCASDIRRAVISDYGFIHLTDDGGTTWRQAYVRESHTTPVGAPTPKQQAFTGNGAEDTSCWWLEWLSPQVLFAGFTDVRGMRSADGGSSWQAPMTLPYNSTYHVARHPNGRVYGAMSSVHDLYAWDRYCRDADLDAGTGAVMMSADLGATWTLLWNAGHPVVAVTADPALTNRLYAALVHSTLGGIFRTENLSAGTTATWTRLAVPPRTQGHPYHLIVLPDGALLATYCARIAHNDFQPSSGVFLSTDDGASWLDRTHPDMRYYTKDLTVDPADQAGHTWWAGVWGEWGSSNGKGGLYRTTNRGETWTRVSNLKAVNGAYLPAGDPGEIFVCTEDQGLWHGVDRSAATPILSAVKGYPFRFPTRVFFNPHDANEVWVTSYGNGLRLGRRADPALRLTALDPGSPTAVSVGAAPGQRVVVEASADHLVWSAAATNTCFDAEVTLPDAGPADLRFYRARLR
jgi:hypothetical protein